MDKRIRELTKDEEIVGFLVSDRPDGMSDEDARGVQFQRWLVISVEDGPTVCAAHGTDCDHARDVAKEVSA